MNSDDKELGTTINCCDLLEKGNQIEIITTEKEVCASCKLQA